MTNKAGLKAWINYMLDNDHSLEEVREIVNLQFISKIEEANREFAASYDILDEMESE